MILFLLECGNISEDTGIEIINKFNLHKSIIKAMLKMNTKYELSLVAKNNEVRKAILVHHNCTLDMARNMFN